MSPLSMGAMVGPEAFTEVRYLAHHKQFQALQIISDQAVEFEAIFGRNSGGLIKSFEAEGAETVVVTMGSVIGTMKEVLAEMREEDISIGALTIRSFRPFPSEALREALKDAKRVIVFEKSVAVGMGGIVAMNLRTALQDFPIRVHSVIGGLGGRPITRANLRRMFDKGIQDQMEEPHFHDIHMDVVNREIEREKTERRSGAIAENILHDVGVVAAAKAI